jgi:hypothetical protein
MNHKFGKLRLCFGAALLALGIVAVAAPSASALVRPRTATPYSVPLVVAYNQCVPPGNSTHNPANLAGASCVPETKASPYLTAGEPPAAGAAKFEGRLHLVVCITATSCSAGGGSGSTDVLFPSGVGKSYALDIRCEAAAPSIAALCPNGNAAGGPDYGSGVPPATASLAWATAKIRITDRNNGAPGYTSEGTVEDLDFPVPAICQPTTDTTIGGTCTPLIASANGACGGCVAAGKLSNVEIDDLRVQDPGADGNASTPLDNRDAARPGVFIP